LVELHGGRLDARSDGIGKGSEFIVYLPASNSQLPPDAIPPDTPHRQINIKRILIADDNHAAVDTLARLLELDGHRIAKAYNGEQALSVVESFHPEIILLDIGMPKIDGYEVAQRIRAKSWGPDVKIIGMSGWAQEKDHRAHAGVLDHYLIKPVNSEAIAKLLAD
jgi:two-component system, chemotaxis family, CheB/CheR fusion protein